jgi:hypothetical protein
MNITIKKVNETIRNYNNGVNNKSEEKSPRETAFEKIKAMMQPESRMTEEQKKAYEDKIYQKARNGEKLTPSELEYIRRTNPEMYIRIKRVQMQREMLERKLKNCKSKKEVEEVYMQSMSSIGKKDPDREMLYRAYQKVTMDFKKTLKYKSLPEVEEDEKEKGGRKKKQRDNGLAEYIDDGIWDDMEISTFDAKA